MPSNEVESEYGQQHRAAQRLEEEETARRFAASDGQGQVREK
jgi:hypothetical protein